MTGPRLAWLVMRRELREGVRGKTFLISSAFVLLLLGGVVALGALTGGGQKTVRLGVAGRQPQHLGAALATAAKPFDEQVSLHRYPSAAAARDAVSRRKVDAALVDGARLVVRPSPPKNVVPIVGAALRELVLPGRVSRLGISAQQARQLLEPPVTVSQIQPAAGNDTQAEFLAFASAVLLFMSLSMYGQAVMMSVVQEKASRIVEVLLATLHPRQLLAGKVAGVGLLGLVQIAVLAVAALVAGRLGAFDVPSLGRTAPLALVWFLLGFALYATAYAAVGALVSRLEDASTAATPVAMAMVVCYLASFAALPNPDGPLAAALTLLPLSAPFVLPARAAATAIPLWQHGLAIALMLAAVWGVVRLGGRVYELGLLRSGPRVQFREALRTALGRA